jgi:alkylation response protein AidB-like acyl-CoA dehydrogenase
MAVLTEEQSIFRDAAKGWVADRAPVAALRRLRDGGGWSTGYNPATWHEMAQMGWAGVIIPEAYGGSDFGHQSLGLVLEETGRTLTASPLHSTALVVASTLILGGTEAQKQAWLPRIAAGEIVATLAVDETAHHAPAMVAMRAEKSGADYVLTGKKRFIPDASSADLIVVAARTSGKPGETEGITLFLVESGAAGLTTVPLHAIDTRGAADLTFDRGAVSANAVLGKPGQGWTVLEPALDRARVGLAAEMLGTASEAFEITLDYLKTRTQFGQSIGAFQALQHRAAKMFTELELTRSAIEAALEAIDAGADDIAALASLAKAKANDTLHLVSNEMVQMHGGIGMTDAHDAGLYLKRARVAEALYGSSSYHRDRYARLGGY